MIVELVLVETQLFLVVVDQLPHEVNQFRFEKVLSWNLLARKTTRSQSLSLEPETKRKKLKTRKIEKETFVSYPSKHSPQPSSSRAHLSPS